MYSSFVLGAAGAAGAGSLVSEMAESDPKHKKTAVTVSVVANVLQAMIGALNDSQYAPRRVSQDHRKAGDEMKAFQGRLDYFRQVDMHDAGIPLEELQKGFKKYQEEKKNLGANFIKSENWTFKQVHEEIAGTDRRRESAKEE